LWPWPAEQTQECADERMQGAKHSSRIRDYRRSVKPK
jgi:hypothetical protein